MKKVITWLLLFVTCFSFTACETSNQPQETQPNLDYSVRKPMQYPDYTFEGEPTTTELRKMAVKAMQDILSIEWCTPKELKFKNDGPDNKKIFHNVPGRTYGGLPYTLASTGIFQFFEFYDSETGNLLFPGGVDELKRTVGAACADSFLWGWTTVCNSVQGGYYPTFMVPANGFIPVGDYTIKEGIQSYHEMPTYTIHELNGTETMLEAYAQTLPADLLVSTRADHALMVVQKPVVLHNADGTIDTSNSFVYIQDQRVGEYFNDDFGIGVPHYGRINEKTSFDELLEWEYIPLTAAEFIGAKAYDKAEVSTSAKSCATLAELSQVTVSANYPLAIVNLVGKTSAGNQQVLNRVLFNGASSNGVPRTYKVSEMGDLQQYITNDITEIALEVVVSTGERFYPITFTLQ